MPTPLTVRAVAAGYGGVGPATPPPHPDTWVIAFLDLEATTSLIDVQIQELELLDAAGNVVARARPPWSLRRDTTADDGRRERGDFSEAGTLVFDGQLRPGSRVRLRVHAPLDQRSPLRPPPARFRARLGATDAPAIWVEGPVQGPWATG
jgi:hypothetical protein